MSKNEYQPFAHTHVLFTRDLCDDGSFGGPCPIVHHVGERVWVFGTYADFPAHHGVDYCHVGDGHGMGYSHDGGCIISVNVKYVHSYLTDEQANSVQAAIDADERLLGYAIG